MASDANPWIARAPATVQPLADRSVMEKILRVCRARAMSPYAQRYHSCLEAPCRTAPGLNGNRYCHAQLGFDRLYPQRNEESALQQLQIQLASPLPYDLEDLSLAECKNLDARWHDWPSVKAVCLHCATIIFDRIVGVE